MRVSSHQHLASYLQTGHVFRREALVSLSKAVDRDLITLVNKGVLEKLGAGLYYKPALSRFGTLPPKEEDLIKSFLRDDSFLVCSWNQYNTLGLGLTQLYNRLVIYNYKRHGLFELNGKNYDFRRPARGFPNVLTREFLLVDLVNNLNELAEEHDHVKTKIEKNLCHFNLKKVTENVKKYGKMATRHFFEEIIH